MGRDAYAHRPLLRMEQPARDLVRRGQDERIAAGSRGLQGPEHRIADLDELAHLREVVAHECEVMLAVEIADLSDAVQPLPVADLAPELIAGVGRVRDQPAVTYHSGDLLEQPWLR